MSTELTTPVVLDIYNAEETRAARDELEAAELEIMLDYRVSRLRTALRTWSTSLCSTEEMFVWRWQGLVHELVSQLIINIDSHCDPSSKTVAMSIVGHAATLGIPVEVPAFLKGLSSSMVGYSGPYFSLSPAMQEYLGRGGDGGPYRQNWWVHSRDNSRPDHQLLDIARAFQCHRDKVRMIILASRPLSMYIKGDISTLTASTSPISDQRAALLTPTSSCSEDNN